MITFKLNSKWLVDAILIISEYYNPNLGDNSDLGDYRLFVGNDPDYIQNIECLQASGANFYSRGTEAWCV